MRIKVLILSVTSKGRERGEKTNAKQKVRQSYPRFPSPLMNQPNNEDHL